MKISILAYRVFHGLISVFFIGCILYIYFCAFAGQFTLLLGAAVAVLLAEGLAVRLNGGDCPLAGFQHRLGDDVPFFALILPAPLAKKAIPFFTTVTLVGVVLVIARLALTRWL